MGLERPPSRVALDLERAVRRAEVAGPDARDAVPQRGERDVGRDAPAAAAAAAPPGPPPRGTPATAPAGSPWPCRSCPGRGRVIVWPSERTSVQRSMTFASPGMCSQIETPGAAVAIGRNSPRISSGASGLRSHMSIVAGPPESQIWITPVAGFFTRGSGASGPRPAARRAGDSPSSPATPTRRTSRRWNPSQSVRVRDIAAPSQGRRPGSVVQHEFARVDQRPEHVGQARGAVGARPEMVEGRPGLVPGRGPRQGGEEELLDRLRVATVRTGQRPRPGRT